METLTVTPEMTIQEKVAIWRQKLADGALTLEDSHEIIKYLRADRLSAVGSARSAKTPASRQVVDISDL